MNHISPRMTCGYIRRVCRAKAVKNIINNVLARQLSGVSTTQRKAQPIYQHLAITSAVMILTMVSVMTDMENLAAVAVQVAAVSVVAVAVAVLSVAGAAAVAAVAGAAAAVVVGEAAAASVLVMLFSLNNKISFRVALY
ncbi:MAG: hypothetical protein BHW56_02545 [Acetobacter sp. 46_36]|nr:MAG: hypothetical protein BHW56_02545 [Acetobacter sp. 46_36]